MNQLTTTKVNPTPADFRSFITVRDQSVRTTSLKVAEAFGKEHRVVLKAIKGLECSEDFITAQFGAMTREVATGSHGGIRKFPFYEMTKDGFVFLVMGFTGKQAASIKEAYIAAFNWMAEQLEQKEQGIWDTTIGTDGVHVLAELVGGKVKKLPRPLQHSARMTLWSRLHSRFNVARAELIPADQMDSAANFLAAYVYEGTVEDKPAQAMKPVEWTRPHQYGQLEDQGMPRADRAIKKILRELRKWGIENLHDDKVANSFHGAINDVEALQVTCWTYIDESLSHISMARRYLDSSLEMLHRWQGRGGRIGNVGP